MRDRDIVVAPCALRHPAWIRRFVAVVLVVAAGRAAAQAPARELRLADLLADVRRANPSVAALRAAAEAAQARVAGVRRPPDPQVQLGVMNYAIPALGPMPTVGMVQLQAMQMVPVAGKLSYAGNAADARAAGARERATDAAWDVRAKAVMAFYDLYATDAQLRVMRETLRVLDDIERNAEAMYRVGTGRQADVLRAQVEIARMAADTLRMVAMRAGMAARVNALRDGGDGDVGLARLPAFPDSVPARAWLDSAGIAARPMLRAGAADVRAAESSEQLARRELWPDLNVGVQLGQRGGDMGREWMGSLMVGASVPVFARDRQLAMRDEASAMTRMAAADLAAMRADTRARIAASHAELVRARSLARLYRTTVLPQAEAAVASSLAAYRVGGVDFMTLLDNQMMVNRYRGELAVLEADEGKSWADLEMLLGRELVDLTKTAAPGAARDER